jgi:hypothetical protein
MRANEPRDRERGEPCQLSDNRSGTRTLESMPNPASECVGRSAANDNAKAWPFFPFPDEWYAS